MMYWKGYTFIFCKIKNAKSNKRCESFKKLILEKREYFQL